MVVAQQIELVQEKQEAVNNFQLPVAGITPVFNKVRLCLMTVLII